MIFHVSSSFLALFILGLAILWLLWNSNIFLSNYRTEMVEQIRFPAKFSDTIQPDDESLVAFIREEYMREPSKVRR